MVADLLVRISGMPHLRGQFVIDFSFRTAAGVDFGSSMKAAATNFPVLRVAEESLGVLFDAADLHDDGLACNAEMVGNFRHGRQQTKIRVDEICQSGGPPGRASSVLTIWVRVLDKFPYLDIALSPCGNLARITCARDALHVEQFGAREIPHTPFPAPSIHTVIELVLLNAAIVGRSGHRTSL